MPRLPLVDPDDPHADPHARALLGRVQELGGRTLNVYRAIGNHPEVLKGVLAFGAPAYFQNSLTPAHRELAYLSASVANDWLTDQARFDRGGSAARRGVRAGRGGHRALRAGVERLEPITDELYAALLAHFTEKQIIEICFTVGMSNMINRFHATFHTDVDAGTEELLGAVCPVRLPRSPGGSAPDNP